MFLKTRKPSSNASRKVTFFSSKWFNRKSFTALTYRKKWLAGRSSQTGRIIVRTKQSLLRRINLLKINYTLRSLDPGFVSTFKLVPFSSKLLVLAFYPSGAVSYLPASTSASIFSLLYFKKSKRTPDYFQSAEYVSAICFAPLFRKVSNIELTPGRGVQYARSAGSHALIIRRNFDTHTALVKLPSGVKKIFSAYSVLLLAPAALKWKRRIANTRSGYWRSYGSKSQVRGVAMNPVDHPHGGRTKAIKYPRTPWGKTTKFK